MYVCMYVSTGQGRCTHKILRVWSPKQDLHSDNTKWLGISTPMYMGEISQYPISRWRDIGQLLQLAVATKRGRIHFLCGRALPYCLTPQLLCTWWTVFAEVIWARTEIQNWMEISTQCCNQETEVIYEKREVHSHFMLLSLYIKKTWTVGYSTVGTNKNPDMKSGHKNQNMTILQYKIKMYSRFYDIKII